MSLDHQVGTIAALRGRQEGGGVKGSHEKKGKKLATMMLQGNGKGKNRGDKKGKPLLLR